MGDVQDTQTDTQTDRIFGEGYFYVQLTHMNGFKAKKNSEGVEKCIARGIRCFAAMPKKQNNLVLLS